MIRHSRHCATHRVGLEIACNCTPTVEIAKMPDPYTVTPPRRPPSWLLPAAIAGITLAWCVAFALVTA